MGFPRVSETFIASEIHRVEQAGVPLRLYVIKPVEAREQGHDHPVLDAIGVTPEYLPDPQGLTKPLHLWRYRDIREFAPALRRCVRRRPHGVARAVRTAVAQAFRDRRTRVLRPAQDLHQGADPGDHARGRARPRRPPPARALRARDDDDHLAGRVHHRPAVLVHRPRARHLRARTEPEGLAAAQAARRALRRHLHRGERRATCARSRRAPASTSSTTGSPRTSRGCSPTVTRRRATAGCGSSASGGSSPRRASTCSSTPVRCSSSAASRSTR